MKTKGTGKTKASATAKASMRVADGPYDGVAEMVRANSDPRFAGEFEEHMAARVVVDALTVMRGVAGLTQAELAGRMSCAQSKVSKLESSVDADLGIGDVVRYAAALGRSLTLTFTPEDGGDSREVRVKPVGAPKRSRKGVAPTK